jgi:Double-GTPase 2
VEVLLFAVTAVAYLIYLVIAVPLTAALSCAGYGLGMPVAYLAGLAEVLVVRPPSLPAATRQLELPEDADPAVPQYFYGPAVADADQAVRVGYGRCRKLWDLGAQEVWRSFHADISPLVTGPLGVAGAIGMTVGTAAGAVLAAGCALVHLLVVGVSAGLVRAAGAVLRGADSAILRIKNVRMVCPHCGHKVPYPGYVCPGPGCTQRHRDVRPGRFGIAARRCRCGTRMRTLLLFGSARMTAFCPHPGCGHPLEHQPGHVPETVLPFFGATGAGKTRLVFSMIMQLRGWADAGKLTAEFGDSDTTRELKVADQVLRTGSPTAITSVQLPRAYVIRVTSGKKTRILHLFDAAGELFYDSARTQELIYLGAARTFILVIDPLSVDAFWQRLPAARRAELEPMRSTAPSPDLAYQQAHQQIERMRVQLHKARLAVVFSRADLIDTPDLDTAEWAGRELGLGHLIRSVRRNFGQTAFFRTAAVMVGDGCMHPSVASFTRWVLARDGLALAEDKP